MAGEKIRQILRLSIVIFFTLAIFFFLMIFLLGLARKWDLKNQIDLEVPIQQFDNSTWGEIPGKLGYGWTRTYRLFGFDSEVTSDDATITLSTKGEYEYDMTRSFEAPFWYP